MVAYDFVKGFGGGVGGTAELSPKQITASKGPFNGLSKDYKGIFKGILKVFQMHFKVL